MYEIIFKGCETQRKNVSEAKTKFVPLYFLMRGENALVTRTTPNRFTSANCLYFSIGMSSTSAIVLIAALLTTARSPDGERRQNTHGHAGHHISSQSAMALFGA